VKGTEIGAEYDAIATAVATKADLASPTLTGTPTVPTAAVDTATTQAASTAYVINQVYAKGAATTATANRALISDSNGKVTAATTTATEIGYVNGVTSAIQTQLNAKAPTASPAFTGSWSGSGQLSLTGGTMYLYGHSADNNQAVLYMNIGGSRYIYNNGSTYIFASQGITISGALAGATTGSFSSSVTATDFTISSDARKKQDITPIRNALGIVGELEGVRFTYKASGKKSVGFIAQEVEDVLPELVSTDEEGFKSVSYGQVVAVLVEAIKELKAEVDLLKASK